MKPLPLLAVLLLSMHVHCLSTFSFSFNSSVNSPIRLPAYPLGYIPANTSVNFDIRAYNTLATLSTVTATLVDAATLTQVGTNTKACANTQICQSVFYVTTPGNYYLKLGQTAPSPNYVEPFSLVVVTYPGHTTYVGNPQQKLVLRTGDVLREFYVGKGFYIATKSNVTFKLGPFQVDPGAGQPPLAIYPTDPITFAYSNFPDGLTATYLNKMLVGSRVLNPGYYFFVINNVFTEEFLTIEWQSDNYDCQYDSSYTDIYGLLQGCTRSQSNQGMPCKSFNAVTRRCTECLSGYVLDAGSAICLANTTCPPRQYYHFGACYPVSDKCLDFDPFTGNCLTCINSSYILNNTQCVAKVVVCGDRQWIRDGECRNISDDCSTFGPANGNCVTCVNSSYQVVNGTCVPIVVVCPPGQYEFNLQCLTIPSECLKFDTEYRICTNCIQGYYLQDGQCQRIVCPPNQVPSRVGLSCVDVSPLCFTFDPLNGACLSCNLPNYRVNPNGECVQVVSPLAGCRERQNLGFGACIEPELNCFAYNLVTGNCDKCEEKYSLDYTGICVPKTVCPQGKWSVNGQCLEYPPNCKQVNEIGLCVRCVNFNYTLERGQCVYKVRCAAYQYLNDGGQCVDVSRDCDLFNPTNGDCITCKSGNDPQQGHCCPFGQIYDGQRCTTRIRNPGAGADCVVFHPSLRFCLGCNPGFTPDLTTQTACIPE